VPKRLTVGLLSPLDVLDPRRPQQESVLVLRQTLEPPFDLGAGEIAPVLFEGALRPGPRPNEYRGRVRPGVFFSDGVPLTAQAVADCLRSSVPVRSQAEVSVDGDSVVFTLNRPNSRLEASMTHAHSYVHRRVGSQIIGTGPFMMSPERTAQEVRLVRNPHFRRPVALEEVHFRVYPPGPDGRPTALLDALRRGEVDLTTVLPRDAVNQLTGVRKAVLPGLSTAIVFFNVERRLADPRLRQALARSIDRAEFAADAYENPMAFTATSLLPRAMANVRDGLDHDPVRARAILAEAALQPPPRLSLLLIWAPRPYLPNPGRAAEILARQLSKLGVALDVVRTKTLQDYYDRMIEGRQDLTLGGWTADTMDACDFLESCLASDRVPTAANASVSVNNARLRSEKMDRALADYRAERMPARLDAVLRQIEDEAPVVPLMHGSTCTVSAFRVANLTPSPLAFMDLSGLDLTD
jgi:peptide/nickel transport system substrate-binding protein